MAGWSTNSSCLVWVTPADLLGGSFVTELDEVNNNGGFSFDTSTGGATITYPFWRVFARWNVAPAGTVPDTSGTSSSGFCTQGPPIKYKIIKGLKLFDEDHDRLKFDEDTGMITGRVPELDNTEEDFIKQFEQFDGKFTFSNYATIGSSALFSGNTSTPYTVKFTARAYPEGSDPYDEDVENYIEKEFSFDVVNNWSSDRDNLIGGPRQIQDQSFQIDRVPVTNEEFLRHMKTLGYYPPR